MNYFVLTDILETSVFNIWSCYGVLEAAKISNTRPPNPPWLIDIDDLNLLNKDYLGKKDGVGLGIT